MPQLPNTLTGIVSHKTIPNLGVTGMNALNFALWIILCVVLVIPMFIISFEIPIVGLVYVIAVLIDMAIWMNRLE